MEQNSRFGYFPAGKIPVLQNFHEIELALPS